MDIAKATQGIRQMLSKLEDEELFGLAATVTQGLLKNKLDTRTGAIEAVIRYSPNISSILKRKTVTRDVMFAYLHESGIYISLPVTKNELIERLSQYWNIRNAILKPSTSNETTIFSGPSQRQVEPQATTAFEINTMALKFSEWYYMMMNSDEPIGTEHFWEEGKLKLHLMSSAQNVDQTVENNVKQIVELLYKTKCEHNLYFNPNFLVDGIQGRMDPHGLVVVLACGTLHSNNVCVGVFEQVFMLARDPCSDNNWKIKSTELNLKSKGNVIAAPSLSDGSLTLNLLALPLS